MTAAFRHLGFLYGSDAEWLEMAVPFALDGGYKIPVKIHPFMPPGTIVGWAENLPAQYQSSNVPNVAEVKTRRDYYRMDWPLKTRAYEFGVYAEAVLAVYAPFAMGVIGNIANG